MGEPNISRCALEEPRVVSRPKPCDVEHITQFCSHSVKKAALSLGIPYVPDYNSPSVPSVSCAALDITTDGNMRRSSTFAAFLPSALANARKSHLTICTSALVSRIVFDSDGSGQPR